MAVHDHQSDVAALEGVEKVSKLIYRYAVFESVYLRGEQPLQSTLKVQLEKAIKELYTAVLLYLLNVNTYFNRSAGGMIQLSRCCHL